MRFSNVEMLELEAQVVEGHEVSTDLVVFESGSFWLGIYNDSASVEVQTSLVREPPTEDISGDESVEFSCHGPAEIRDPERPNRRMAFLPEANVYRVRVSNEQQGRRQVLHLTAWPSPAAPTQVLRRKPEPPHCLDLPEAPAAMRAAARIGRDVDRAEGHRVLSGETGIMRTSGILPGTPSGLCAVFSGFHAFTRSRSDDLRAQAWEMGGQADYGTVAYPRASDHPDRLTGANGVLALRDGGYWKEAIEAIRQGRRTPTGPVVVSLNWYVSDRPIIDPATPTELSHARAKPLPPARANSLQPFLPEWTTRTVSFKSVRPATKPPSSHVEIVHEGIPVEWIEDLEAWWTFQLAIDAVG